MWGDVLPIATLVLGWALGHLSGVWRERYRLITERQLEHVAAFLAQAYTNLGYLVDRETDGVLFGRDFTVMGHKAGFYVSDGAAEAIGHFTSTWADACTGMTNPNDMRDWYKIVKAELDELRDHLRSEVSVYRRKRFSLPWKREQKAHKPGS